MLDETDRTHIRRHMNSNWMISDYELTGRRKSYFKETTCALFLRYIPILIDGAFVYGLYGSERAGMVALGIVIKS